MGFIDSDPIRDSGNRFERQIFAVHFQFRRFDFHRCQRYIDSFFCLFGCDSKRLLFHGLIALAERRIHIFPGPEQIAFVRLRRDGLRLLVLPLCALDFLLTVYRNFRRLGFTAEHNDAGRLLCIGCFVFSRLICRKRLFDRRFLNYRRLDHRFLGYRLLDCRFLDHRFLDHWLFDHGFLSRRRLDKYGLLRRFGRCLLLWFNNCLEEFFRVIRYLAQLRRHCLNGQQRHQHQQAHQ